MTLIREDDTLKIGRDFVDALLGSPQSHGVAVVGGIRMDWISTLPAGAAESAIRRACKAENARLSLFVSSASLLTTG